MPLCGLTFRLVLMASLLALLWPPRQPASADNVLAPCPSTSNCVCTDAGNASQRVPTVPFTDAAESAQARARTALLAEHRTTVVAERAGYLRAESRSLVFRLVDDVEIVIDPAAHVFRFRSASRVGRNDLGVNRRRVERLVSRLRRTEAP